MCFTSFSPLDFTVITNQISPVFISIFYSYFRFSGSIMVFCDGLPILVSKRFQHIFFFMPLKPVILCFCYKKLKYSYMANSFLLKSLNISGPFCLDPTLAIYLFTPIFFIELQVFRAVSFFSAIKFMGFETNN